MIIVGIDPGVNNGFALIDKENSKIELHTLMFWELITKLKYLAEIWPAEYLKIYLEWPNGNRPTFNRGVKGKVQEKVSQNVGGNKRTAELIAEFCELNKIKLVKLIPNKHSGTKLPVEQFRKLTGFTGKCSEHARDAAMLIVGR